MTQQHCVTVRRCPKLISNNQHQGETPARLICNFFCDRSNKTSYYTQILIVWIYEAEKQIKMSHLWKCDNFSTELMFLSRLNFSLLVFWSTTFFQSTRHVLHIKRALVHERMGFKVNFFVILNSWNLYIILNFCSTRRLLVTYILHNPPFLMIKHNEH